MTVRDAVLARVARLGAAARGVLEAVAVVPQGCEYWLLDRLAPGASDHLDECLSSGMLLAGPPRFGSATSWRGSRWLTRWYQPGSFGSMR